MPIVDYKKKAEQSKLHLLENKSISEINKTYIRNFFNSYDVSPARLSLFCKHIVFLLERSEDIKKDMLDRDKINKIFKDIRDNTKVGYYETIKAVSLRFVRWLNDEDKKPIGFKDIKNSKKGQKRYLRPQDMITLEDAQKLLKNSKSVQLDAIIMTQLDGGFRPSEFYDIRYSDVVKKKGVMIINIKASKTNKEREVILFKCVPYLEKWLQAHPSKLDSSRLWTDEYATICKQIRVLGDKAKINKPLDFYNLRHSACTIAKKENVPVELAAKKFGHSVKYFVDTYGRLSTDENIERFRNHYKAISETSENDYVPIKCPICKAVNSPKTKYCKNCNKPLTLEEALKSASELESIKKQLSKSRAQTKDLIKKYNGLTEILNWVVDMKKKDELISVKEFEEIK